MTIIPAKQARIPVGISACLMGQAVRYNGAHKRSRYCVEVLSDCFSFRPYCPELAIGMGVPRQPIQLVGDPEAPRALGVLNPSLDATAALAEKGRLVASTLPDLCGYIVIKGSPSCGMEDVTIHHPDGRAHATGSGIFIRALRAANPLLPVEEEGWLQDPVRRQHFMTRVFALHRWKCEVEAEPGYHALLRFHRRNQYLLMAHSDEGYRLLGRYLAGARQRPLEQAVATYIRDFMGRLSRCPSRSRHTQVLMQLFDYLKRKVDGDHQQAILAAIDQYRRAEVQLRVPLTLLKHQLDRYGSAAIKQQTYLDLRPYQ